MESDNMNISHYDFSNMEKSRQSIYLPLSQLTLFPHTWILILPFFQGGRRGDWAIFGGAQGFTSGSVLKNHL